MLSLYRAGKLEQLELLSRLICEAEINEKEAKIALALLNELIENVIKCENEQADLIRLDS